MTEFNFFNDSSFQVELDSERCANICTELFANQNKKAGWINVICMNENPHKRLNLKYLNHDYATDVITFDFTEEETVNGEIYINVKMANRNAIEHSVTLLNEIQRLIVHGALHLVGFDDQADQERLEMHELENFYLKSFM
jgi:probable rRNA maturation factor